MLDVFAKPDSPSDSQSPLPTMTNSGICSGTKSLWQGKKLEARNLGSWKSCLSEVEEDDDGLELSLGLSLFSKTKKSDVPKPLRVDNPKLQKQSTGGETVHGEVVLADQALPSEALGFPIPMYGLKQGRGEFEGPVRQSRDQIWQALQKNGSVSVQSMHAESLLAFQELKDASASLWKRRCASMQPFAAVKKGCEAAPQCIRRSNSSDVIGSMMSQQYQSAPPSRQVSSVESLLEKSPEVPTHLERHNEALEQQRKKEIQAQRRQEARKRRKSLIEEKQQKKAKKDDKGYLSQIRCSFPDPPKNPSASVTSQDASFLSSQSSVLRRLDCKQYTQPTDDFFLSGVVGAECQKEHMRASYPAITEQKWIDPTSAMAQEEERKSVSDKGSFGDSEGDSRVLKTMICPACCSDDQTAPTVSSSSAQNAVMEATGPQDNGGEKACTSSSSDLDSEDTKEEHNSVHYGLRDLEALNSKKCAIEASHSLADSGPSRLPSIVGASNPVAYPPPFPILPIPHPFRAPGAPSAMPQQIGLSLPCFMQCPTPASGGEVSLRTSSHLPAIFPAPVASSLNPYGFPVPDGNFPCFQVVSSVGTLQSSGISRRNDATGNESAGGKCTEEAEKPSVSEMSMPIDRILQRMRTTSNSKDAVRAQCVPSSKHFYCQVSVSATQLSPYEGRSELQTERRKDSPAVNRKLAVERHQCLPPTFTTLPPQAGVVGQSALTPHIERHGPQPKGVELKSDRSGGITSDNFKLALNQDEGSADSQLANENSGLDASIVQLGVGDGQKDRTFADLPWVYTTGVGPNGKTINGVMYISTRRQVRLVCSCHGIHMSPIEFVQHSGSSDLSNPERSIVVTPYPALNQLAATPV